VDVSAIDETGGVGPGGAGSGGAGSGGAGSGGADGAGDRDEEARVVELAARLGRRLQALGWTVATVESCTGGLVARALTETAGSSAWFDRGFVTYTNEAKVELVGVCGDTLAAHGAVSEPTAREMAAGGLANSRSRVALSVTGIAGPGGAVPGKPVGTVCFGWAIDARVTSDTRYFAGDRRAVRLQAALHALGGLLDRLAADPKD